MAGFTPKYQMAYFDFADKLAASVNVQKEIERFVFIDKQLYGLYNVFGNGVISGWEVYDNGYSDSNGISIGISSGMGIINNISCQSTYPKILNNLTPNRTLYVYAALSGNSESSKDVVFLTTTRQTNDNYIRLAAITLGSNSVSSIDNTFRDLLSFEQITQDLINNHKHRGSPTKIDLETEVKNQLPGARVENVDISKFTNGRLDITRMPSISHSNLQDIGIMSHAQIDTALSSFTGDNQIIAGTALVNYLRTVSYTKLNINDIDKYLVNQTSVIAGISQNIDSINSTSFIDNYANVFAAKFINNNSYYIFSNNIVLDSAVKKILITHNKDSVPIGGSIVFGINSDNSTTFNDYTVITENSIASVTMPNTALRVAAKITNPSVINPFDSTTDYRNYLAFSFTNSDIVTKIFNFRTRFYTDEARTSLYLTKETLIDVSGWNIGNETNIEAGGYSIDPSQTVYVYFYPDASNFSPETQYYLVTDVWDGSSYISEESTNTFISSGIYSDEKYVGVTRLNDFSFIFELTNGELVKINL